MHTQDDVDEWIRANNKYDAYQLLDEVLPKHRAKLERLDKRIRVVLAEIREEFPDAQYYTASGGFMLVLGDTHDIETTSAQRQRSAWHGYADIGDGDW